MLYNTAPYDLSPRTMDVRILLLVPFRNTSEIVNSCWLYLAIYVSSPTYVA